MNQKNFSKLRKGNQRNNHDWEDIDYTKALGEERVEEIKEIVKKEKRKHVHARIEK